MTVERIVADISEGNVYEAITRQMEMNWSKVTKKDLYNSGAMSGKSIGIVMMHSLDAIKYRMVYAKNKYGKKSVSYLFAKREYKKYIKKRKAKRRRQRYGQFVIILIVTLILIILSL